MVVLPKLILKFAFLTGRHALAVPVVFTRQREVSVQVVLDDLVNGGLVGTTAVIANCKASLTRPQLSRPTVDARCALARNLVGDAADECSDLCVDRRPARSPGLREVTPGSGVVGAMPSHDLRRLAASLREGCRAGDERIRLDCCGPIRASAHLRQDRRGWPGARWSYSRCR